DVVLPKRNFGGKTNIPYFFQKYEIGTSASLTINPGVICKFLKQSYWDTSYLNVSKGLIALGGSTPDSIIVFTSLLDDFYGGDSNADSTKTFPATTDWSGLNFADQSLDPLCKLKNCIVRFADTGLNTTSASPTITNCSFNNNAIGANITGASNPTFSNCDFSENHNFGIKNVDKSFNINATQCWWGSNAGPVLSESASNGSLEQEYVTSLVNYIPWKTTGAINPLMGDVSLNGLIQAYDASLVLKNTVGLLTLSPTQQRVADVSGTAGVTAFDASLILQYVVGKEATFPINKVKKSSVDLLSEVLSVGNTSVNNTDEFALPLSIKNMNALLGTNIKLSFNPQYLQAVNVENLLSSTFMEFNIDNVQGKILIAMARSVALNGDRILANLKFKAIAPLSTVAEVYVTQFLANEDDCTLSAISGSITIMRSGTGLMTNFDDKPQGMAMLYPNPFKDEARLVYQLDDSSKWVKIDIFNLMGQNIATLVNKTQAKGTYSIKITNIDYPLESGTYIVKMQTSNYKESQLIQVNK
ncbi:MAG: T9SS type A sorting domain-containing protein, partial [Paludibacter sp.]|nr:T9SS type A sorting domain-containing protein [Paludibacter sp.]